jgi:hypothetical protein
MPLPFQTFAVKDVAAFGIWPQPGLLGFCVALDAGQLLQEATSQQLSLHSWLQRLTMAALWQERSRQKNLCCYELSDSVVRVLLSSYRPPRTRGFSQLLARSAAYLEAGDACIPMVRLRPFVFWEPPATMVALWPSGLDDRSDGKREVDTGGYGTYFSYELDEDPVDREPEYLLVLDELADSFSLWSNDYPFFNRFVAINAFSTAGHDRSPGDVLVAPRQPNAPGGEEEEEEEAKQAILNWLGLQEEEPNDEGQKG